LAILVKYILFKLKLKNFEMFNIKNKEIKK